MTTHHSKTHEKLLEELRAVIDNAAKMLAYTESHTSEQCQEARRRLASTLDMARMELATFEAAHQEKLNASMPSVEHAVQKYTGQNTIFRAFR